MSQFKSCYADAFNMLCGDKLGEGIHRTVFACKLLPDAVVKVEKDYFRYFANVFESKFWSDHSDYEAVAKWLAPVMHMSPDGRILLQRRADPVPASYELPDKMPAFLSDFKRENFGLLEGRLVCLDYAMTIPNPSTRLKKAYWT